MSRGLSCGADVQSVRFSRGVGLGGVIFNTDHNNGLTCITALQKERSRAVNRCARVRPRAGERQRVQLLGTGLLPAHCVTPLSLHVLPSQVFCNW